MGRELAPRRVAREALHVAIIMDGNGRWATLRGLPRLEGHRRGAEAVRTIVAAAADAPVAIDLLTLYAFSADNWQRPSTEVQALMNLFAEFLEREAVSAVRERVRVSVIGRRDRLSRALAAAIDGVEWRTRRGDRLHVRFAIDYSGRDAIWQAARAIATRTGRASREWFESAVASGRGVEGTARPVDLLVRTGGEQRLSDFLLWECAYAELHFTATLWPEFTAADLEEALHAFSGRHRRFGRLAPLAHPSLPHAPHALGPAHRGA
jgi:undecaprenyl diphosphate synthase